jgi:hypothetical protein
MTALAAEKAIVERARFFGGAKLPIAAGEIIYAGATIVAVAGEWANVTATNAAAGKMAEAYETVDNTADGKSVEGIFYNKVGKWLTPFRNDTGGTPVAATDLGGEVYFLDNQTVTMTAGAGDPAGIAWALGDLDSFGTPNPAIVWVEIK